MAVSMEKNAITYLRWSTLEQGNCDRSSQERQDATTRRMAAAHNWPIVETHIDSGRSAFTGANLTKGELGKLTHRLLSGVIDPTSHVLIVEEMDRLSRQSPSTMIAWLTPLLNLGLTVAIANTGQIMTRAVMETDFGGFITLMSSAFSSHDFSRKQRERGNASWEKRRASAADGKVLSRHRARGWLRWDDTKKDYVEIADRVWLVHEMFRLRLKGWGKGAIAKEFNKLAGESSIYRAWSTSKTPPKAWTASAIARIVQDRAVCGFIQYNRNPRGAEKKVAVGDPIKVYPAVIDDETWARANEERFVNQLKSQGRGRAVTNMLGPLARCASCGGVMNALGSARWRANKDGSRTQHYFLYCQAAKMSKGQGCDNQRGWTYSKIEAPILDRLLARAIDDQHFRSSDDVAARLEGEVIQIQRRVADLKAKAKRLLILVEADDEDDDAAEAYAANRVEIKAAQKALVKAQEALAQAQGRVSPQEHIVRVGEVRSRMESDDVQERYEARTLVKVAFANLIESIRFEPRTGAVDVLLVDRLGFFVIEDGVVTTDLDLTTMYPDERDDAGRYGPVTVIDDGETKSLNVLTGFQDQARSDYLRRIAA